MTSNYRYEVVFESVVIARFSNLDSDRSCVHAVGAIMSGH
jgi:hypothetical protein